MAPKRSGNNARNTTKRPLPELTTQKASQDAKKTKIALPVGETKTVLPLELSIEARIDGVVRVNLRESTLPTLRTASPHKEDTEEERMLGNVVNAVGQSNTISESSREMLCRMARASLSVPAQESVHRYSVAVSDMVRGALLEVHGERDARVSEASARIDEARALQDECAKKTAAADRSFSKEEEAYDVAKAKFCEDNLALQVARLAFDKAKLAKSTVNKEVHELTDLSSRLEIAIRDHYPPLLTGSSADVAQHLAVLMPLVNRVSGDESLARVLKHMAHLVAGKRPQARSSFDLEALNQLKKDIEKHQADFAVRTSTANNDMAALRKREVETEAALARSRGNMKASAALLREAEMNWRGAETSVGFLEESERESADAIVLAERERDQFLRDVEDFQTGPMAHLDTLCQKRDELPRGAKHDAIIGAGA